MDTDPAVAVSRGLFAKVNCLRSTEKFLFYSHTSTVVQLNCERSGDW